MHKSFWYEAIKIVDCMEFVKVRPNDKVRPAVTGNLSFTMRSFVAIRTLLLDDLGFKTFSARRFNQDALENLFGHMRQNGCRRVNPTSQQFISGLRCFFMNQLEAPDLSKFNCKADGLEAGIQCVKYIM